MCATLNGELVVSLKRLFPIVIAYNDFLAGARAMRAYHLMVENLEAEFDCRVSLWKFEVLNNPDLLQIAVSDAASAAMVIICLNHESELGAPAWRWIESWLPVKHGQSALFALLDEEKSAPPSAAERYLKKAASRAKMDFLIERFQPMRGAGSLLKSQLPQSFAPASGRK